MKEATFKTTPIRIRMQFIEPLLGSTPGNPEIFRKFKLDKAEVILPEDQKKEEIASLPQIEEDIEKLSTVFTRDPERGLFLKDYIFRGAMKEWVFMGKQLGVTCGETAVHYFYKKAVDQCVMVEPVRVWLLDSEGKNILECKEWEERTLRADTQQGPRICLARSQRLPAGTQLEFTMKIIEPLRRSKDMKTVAFLNEEWVDWCFDWGAAHGFGQWRSGGWGRFEWQKITPPQAA